MRIYKNIKSRIVLGTCFTFILFSPKIVLGQKYFINAAYTNHRFYDSGNYILKQPDKARANVLNLGFSFNWKRLDLGIITSLGVLNEFKYESATIGKTNLVGLNATMAIDLLNSEKVNFINPYIMSGYGFKSFTINNEMLKFYNATYGLGLKINLTNKMQLTISESFNLSLKNLYFNNLQMAVGLRWELSKHKVEKDNKNETILYEKMKTDSLLCAKHSENVQLQMIKNNQTLNDSFLTEIKLKNYEIEQIQIEKKTLADKTTALKNELNQMRKNSWTTYSIYELTPDTLIKLENLKINNYACFTSNYLPLKIDLKKISEINGGVYICTNPYNYYKICIEANNIEPIIPAEFLKYYPEAEIWEKEN